LHQFIERVVHLSPRFTDPAEAAEWVNRNASFAVCGSDEIWKWGQPGFCDPFPNIYYGQRITIPKVAYAVSVGPAPVDRPPSGLAEMLGAFDWITARDTRTLDLVRTYVPKVEKLSDPVLGVDLAALFPRSQALIEDKLSQLGIGAHIFLADPWPFRPDQVIPVSGGLEIVTSEPSRYTTVGPLEPPEWAALHATAQRVISQRFHSTILAMKSQTDCVLLAERHKIRDLLEEVGVDPGWRAFRWPSHASEFVNRQPARHAAFVEQLFRQFG
jgi:hypothetical protein